MASENDEDAIVHLNLDRPIPNGALFDVSPSLPSPLSTTTEAHPISTGPRYTRSKPNTRFLSFILRAIVMALVISLFFLFVGIAAIVLVHICIAGRILHRRSTTQYPNSSDEDLDFGFSVGLSSKDLQKLPCFDYGSGAEIESESVKDCAVCLEGFREGERCRILPGCKHVFHANCIDKWLIKSSACPICRGEVELEADIRSTVFREKFVGWI